MAITAEPERALDTLWRPFTQHALRQKPLVIVEGRGSTVVDEDGTEYLDAMAGLWCVNVGYGRERLVEAAAQQMRRLPYTPLSRPAPSALKLAEQMAEILPGDLNHLLLLNSGSEAVEAALKVARQCMRQRHPRQNRHKVIARYRGYHGWTLGALGATGQTVRKSRFEPLIPGFIHVRPPDTFHLFPGLSPSEAARQLADELDQTIEFEGPDTVAAFIGEPIIGGGGVIVPPDEYWPLIRQVCDRHGVLLIQDEVITGFGRTGKWFGCQTFGVVPDIMTMAKGISSGYLPLAATAVTAEVFDAFKGDPADNLQFNQISTYGGHPVACAVALENLAILQEERLPQRAAEVGAHLGDGLRALQQRHPVVGEVRGKGLLWGLDLAKPGTRDPLPIAKVNAVIAAAQQRGVLVGRNSGTVPRYECVVTISPPLVITAEEVDRLVAVLDESLASAQS